MYDKAYRWVAEMEEISDFHGSYKPAADIYAAIARHYEALAAAEAENAPGPDNPIKILDRVLGRQSAFPDLGRRRQRDRGLFANARTASSADTGEHALRWLVRNLDDADQGVVEFEDQEDRPGGRQGAKGKLRSRSG